MKIQVCLGVLSIPAIFDKLGLTPGIICLLAIAIITTWSDYIVGTFKLRHRAVYSIDDAGELIFGRIGREVLGAAFCLWKCCLRIKQLFLTSHRLDLVAGSGMLGISIGLNAVSTHGACTAVFILVAAIAGFVIVSGTFLMVGGTYGSIVNIIDTYNASGGSA